jgi:hypothetical protein
MQRDVRVGFSFCVNLINDMVNDVEVVVVVTIYRYNGTLARTLKRNESS